MSTSKRVVKNTFFLYMRTIVSLLLSVFTTRILLEALGASDFGLYNVVGGSISMLGFVSASLSPVTQRFISYAEGSGDKEKVIKYFNNSIIIHNCLAICMVLVLSIAALFFFNGILNIPEGKYSAAMVIYICMLVCAAFSITVVPYEAEINAHENMFFYALMGIISVVLKFLIAVAVLYCSKDKLIFYAILMALESFLTRYMAQWYCKYKYNECKKTALKDNFDKSIIKQILSFTGWNLTNIATSMISLFGINIIVNHYFGTKVNAAMGIATQVSGVMMGLSINMIKAVTPILTKSEGGNQHEKMLYISYVSCKFSFLIFAFACIPVLVFINTILNIWLTVIPKWTELFCVILITGTLIEQLGFVLYHSIMAKGDIKLFNICRSILNIIPFIATIIIFQKTDIAPYISFVLWAIFYSMLGCVVVNVIFAHIKLGFNIGAYVYRVIKPAIITALSAFIVDAFLYFVSFNSDINRVFFLIFAVIVNIPIFWFAGLNCKERSIFLSFLSIGQKNK